MRSMMPGAGRLTAAPLLTSLGVSKRRLRLVPAVAPADPDAPSTMPRPPDVEPPPAARPAPGWGGRRRAATAGGTALPAPVRFDFGWLDAGRQPTVHSMVVRPMTPADVDALAGLFLDGSAPGRSSPKFRRYLAEQGANERIVLVAESDTTLAGYLCVRWRSTYPPFRAADIPEVVDLNVLAAHRRQGIATVLLEVAEATVATRSCVVGVGFGLHGECGAAQRLYVRRGYVPDGRGVSYAGRPVPAGATVALDGRAALMLTKRVR